MESALSLFQSISSNIKDAVKVVKTDDWRTWAAIGAALLVASRAIPRQKKQLNGGRGGSVDFVDPREKVVIVTGCDSGFGFGTAVELARLGFTVFAGCFGDQAKAKLDAEIERLKEDRNCKNVTGVTFDRTKDDKHAPLGKIICVPLDVTSDESVAAFWDVIEKHELFKKSDGEDALYCLVNNAGINAGYLVELSTVAHLAANMAVNYYGAHRMLLATLPTLRKLSLTSTDTPRIINVTSGAGIMVSSPLGPYSASKHALEGLIDALRQELAHHEYPLHIGLIQPTIALTPIVTADLTAQFDKYLADAGISRELLDAYGGYEYQKAQWNLSAVHLRAKKDQPLILEPEDVVKAIVEEVGRSRGMKIRRPVPEFAMGLVLKLYQNLPARFVDRTFANGQKAAVLEKLEEMRAARIGTAVETVRTRQGETVAVAN